ncbi:hypothetical protein ACIF6L_26370 [Kitasatospora sp. NPDC086009]|uniref:hypothetical protein n=1 Tax=unclassified Kitasatospora TaxID=2633591 RepID=UPI0037C8DEE8
MSSSASAPQIVTVVRPLTVTTANGNPFIVAVGERVTVTLAPWLPKQCGTYRVSGSLRDVSGRVLRYFPDYEPTVRVDRLHRAVTHGAPLARHCDRCHGTGRDLGRISRSHYDWVEGVAKMPTCQACDATGFARTYPAN